MLILGITSRISEKIQSILKASGLKVATQGYEYTSSGITHQGENIYAIIQAPRGDATEAIVLVAAWKTVDGELNLNGVTLGLTLARYFKRKFFYSGPVLQPPINKRAVQAGLSGRRISFSCFRLIVSRALRRGWTHTMICSRLLFSLCL